MPDVVATADVARELAPGLYPNIPADEYHRWPLASQTILTMLRDKSPAHVKHFRDNPPEPTPSQRLGAAVHMAVLQPDLFPKHYVRAPEVDKRTRAGQVVWAAFLEEAGGRIILTPDEWDRCMAMRAAVAAHPIARKLLEGEAERSAIWRDPDTGVLCKGRFDEISRSVGAITDLKTTTDASPEAFSRAIYRYGYYLQAAHYLSGAKALGLPADFFVFIAVEKDPPHAVAVYHVRGDAIQAGLDELRSLLELYARCEATGEWPGYPAEAVEIDLPPWAYREIDGRVA